MAIHVLPHGELLRDAQEQRQGGVADRAAAQFLRARMGGWLNVAKALKVDKTTTRSPSPILAFRLARLVGVGVDDILTGKYPPPGTWPHCGDQQA